MKNWMIVFALFFVSNLTFSQNEWRWTKIASLPVPTTGNAVCEAIYGDEKYVYSFGGISDSISRHSIHQRVFKYVVKHNYWEETTDIPDTLGKIGFKASFVNQRIYLIGGKYMDTDSTETISNRVHVYNPQNDVFESSGTNMVLPVSEHVQAVWRDSLIFVISGRGTFGNTQGVQIYNPYFDSWTIGENLPNDSLYACYGASGYILQDTIFYFGGADYDSTSLKNYFRKGIIDSINPTHITWSIVDEHSVAGTFKGVASGANKTTFWFGGTRGAYAFNPLDSLSNSDSLFVFIPNEDMVELHTKSEVRVYDSPYQIMDMNGIAKLGGGNWIVAGGMDSLQSISNRVFLLHNPELSNIDKALIPPYFQVTLTGDNFVIVTENVGRVKVYDISGALLYSSQKHLADLSIPKYYLQNGILLFVYEDGYNLPVVIKRILT